MNKEVNVVFLDKLLYRPNEVFGSGKLIPVSKATGYELLRTRALSSIRVGRAILIPAEAIANWIASASDTTISAEAGGASK